MRRQRYKNVIEEFSEDVARSVVQRRRPRSRGREIEVQAAKFVGRGRDTRLVVGYRDKSGKLIESSFAAGRSLLGLTVPTEFYKFLISMAAVGPDGARRVKNITRSGSTHSLKGAQVSIHVEPPARARARKGRANRSRRGK